EGAVLEALETPGIGIRKVTDKVSRSVIHAIQKIAYFANDHIAASPGHRGGKKTSKQLIFFFIESVHEQHGIFFDVFRLFNLFYPFIQKRLEFFSLFWRYFVEFLGQYLF